MSLSGRPPWFVPVVIAVAVPTIACFGYYSLAFLGEEHSIWALPVILAYPVALIGFIGLVTTLASPQCSKLQRRLWTLCLIIPVGLLLLVRV